MKVPPVTVSVGLALLAAVPLAPETVLVFTVHHGDEHGQEAGRSCTSPRRPRAVDLCALGVSALPSPAEGAGVTLSLGGSILAWSPVARTWAIRGLVAWALTLDAGLLYLVWGLA